MHQQLGDMSNRIESLTRTCDSPSTVMGPAPCTACGQVAGRSFLHIPLPSCPSVRCPTLIAFFSAPNPPSSTPPTHQSTHPQVTQPLATATPSPTGPAGTANPPSQSHQSQSPPSVTPLPNKMLRIPGIPVLRPDGTKAQKAEAWKDIIRHWDEGDPFLSLHKPLKDWTKDDLTGANWGFVPLHGQRATIAREFIEQ